MDFHFQEQVRGGLLHGLNTVGREGGVWNIHMTKTLTRLTHWCSHIAGSPVLIRLKKKRKVWIPLTINGSNVQKTKQKKNYKVLTIQAEAALRAGRSRSNRTGGILSHGTSQVSTSVARSLCLLKAPLITPLQKHLLSSQKNYIWHISLCLPKVTLWELQYQVWCDHGVWVRKMACGVIYSYYDH